MNIFMGKRGFIYEPQKRMWYRHRSTCHHTPLTQKSLYDGKPLTKPFAKYSAKQQDKIIFRYFCDGCDQQNDGEWDFKYK